MTTVLTSGFGRILGAAAIGAVTGVAILAAAAFIVSEKFDLQLEDW